MPKSKSSRQKRPTRRKQNQLLVPGILQAPTRTELKHIDISIAPFNQSTTLSDQWLTGLITGGSTASTRVGNTITIKRVVVDLWCTNGGSSNCVRGMLALSLNGQQGTPVLGSWYLPVDGDAYYVLKERRINISNSASTAITKPLYIQHNFTNGLEVRYDSASASSEISPRLHLMIVSDAAAATYPSIEGYVRILYTDG